LSSTSFSCRVLLTCSGFSEEHFFLMPGSAKDICRAVSVFSSVGWTLLPGRQTSPGSCRWGRPFPPNGIRQAMTHDDTVDGDAAPGQYSQRLDRGAAAVSEDASCVGQWHVDRLCAESGPEVTAAEARDALERQGVRVAELPRLPVEPPMHIALHPDFPDCVASLGRKLSMELVFGNAKYSFRLLDGLWLADGRRLDGETIEEARRQIPASVNRDDLERVLSILAEVARTPRGLDEIVLWEVVQVLRALARIDYSQRAITEQAVRLSLERREAEMLAAAVAEEHAILKTPRQSPGRSGTSDTRPLTRRPDRASAPDHAGDPEPPAPGPAPGSPLQPVTDLQSRAMPGRTDIVQLSWTPPPTGVVCLRMAAEPPPWPAGTAIASWDTDSYGQPLNANGVLGPDQRMSHELTLPQAQTFVTAITIRDADAVSGRTVEITRGAPVQGLSARRFGEEVRLTWKWPDEAIAAYVAWQPSTAEDQRRPSAGRQQQRCSRRAFEAEGGFAAAMGHAAQRVEVWAVFKGNGKEDVTAPAEFEVPSMGILVRYSFRRVPGLLGPVRRWRRRELVLSSERPCTLPDLIVVECRHPAVPLIPHDDTTVAKIPGGPMDPSEPLRKTVQLDPHGPSWIACFIDPAQPAVRRNRVTLIAPPVGQLRVK
jgi:hypothetical protein